MKKIILTILFLFLTINLAGCTKSSFLQKNKLPTNKTKDTNSQSKIPVSKTTTKSNSLQTSSPLSYKITNQNITVSKTMLPFTDYTPDQLLSTAKDCDKNQKDKKYFQNLLAKFKNTQKIVYNFTDNRNPKNDSKFTITIVPNKAHYTSFADFQDDFNKCEAGAKNYPMMMNNNWLLFVDGCGTGFALTTQYLSCDQIKKEIFPTLKLN